MNVIKAAEKTIEGSFDDEVVLDKRFDFFCSKLESIIFHYTNEYCKKDCPCLAKDALPTLLTIPQADEAVDEESSSSDCNEDDMCDNTEERSAEESEEADDKYAILEVDNGSDSDYEDLDMVEPQSVQIPSVLPQVVLEVVVVRGNEVVKCPHKKKFLDENNEKDKEKRSILIDTLVRSLAIIKQIPHFQ